MCICDSHCVSLLLLRVHHYMNKDIINEKNVSESNSSQIKLHEIIYSDEVSNNFDETDTEILNKTVVSRSQNCSDCGTDI